RAGIGIIEPARDSLLEYIEMLGQHDTGLDHMKIVDLGGIDVGEGGGEGARLFLVVALQTDAVGGPNHRFKEMRQIHDFDSLARSVPASVGEALRQGSLLCVPALHS